MSMRAVAGVVLITLLATGFVAVADINDSHHDWDWSGPGVACYLCHTPHNAITTIPDSPLWNHQLSSAVYTPYSSSTLDSSPGQPAGVSKLCLSCHDGTVAVDSYGTNSGSRFILPRSLIGTDLSKHHPISMAYDASLATADGDLRDPTATASGLGGTITQDLLINGRLECASCHDVHVARNTQGCVGCHISGTPWGFINIPQTLSLRIDNKDSAFCLTCHIK